MDDGLSVGQTLLVASIPAALALLGVIVSLIVGHRHTVKAWEREESSRTAERTHQQQIERDRLLRSERIAVYRRATEAASQVLEASAVVVKPRPEERAAFDEEWYSSRARWSGMFAEIQLVGAASVVEVAQELDRATLQRYFDSMKILYGDVTHVVNDEDREWGRLLAMQAQTNELLRTFVYACRNDIASLPVQ